jgi:HK97 family phage major capsid protein
MPYQVMEQDGEFCVFKEGTTTPLECYDDRDDAEAYFTALTIATADEAKAETDTHTPPEAVADNARMALEVRSEKPPSQQGMTLVGLARARQLAERRPVSVATLRRMVSYFERHEVDKDGATWDEQGKGWQAWMGWGGDEGWAWARAILNEEDSMDETKASRRHSEADMKLIRTARKGAHAIIDIMVQLGDDGADDAESQREMEEGIADIVDALDNTRTMKVEEGDRLNTVKTLPQNVKAIGDYMVKGKGIVFGGFDLTDDRFTADTDLGGSRPFEGMPVFYDHAMGGIKSQIGMVKAWMPSDDGIDVEIELDRRHKYADEVMKLVESGALGLSTGAVSHLVVREPVKGGYEIKRWHVAEISLTPTPAEPRTITEVKSQEADMSSDADITAVPDDTDTVANIDTPSSDIEETKTMPHGIDDARRDEPQLKATLPAAPADNPFDSNEYYNAYKRYMDVKNPVEKSEDYASVFQTLRNATKAYAVKTQTEGTNNDGGFTVPVAVNRDVVAKRDDMSLLGQFNFMRLTTDTWKVVVPAQGNKATPAIVAEGVTATQSEPNISNSRTIQLYKDTIEFAITEELLADTASNYEQFLMNEIARAMAVSVNNFIITGTGSSQPYGIYARVTNDIPFGATSFTSAQLLNVAGGINGSYITPGQTGWVMRNATWTAARTLDISNAGLVLTGYENGRRVIESYPVALSESVQAIGTTNESVIFGNFNYYAFAERTAGVQMERDYDPRTGITYMIAKWRFGGDVTQPEAFALGKHA